MTERGFLCWGDSVMDKQAGAQQPFAQKRERGMDSFKRQMRRNMRRGKGKSALSSVIRGMLVSASITVIAIAVFALVLNWWDASDRAITAINQVVKFVSILAGVTSALSSGAEGGVTRGICVGFLYMLLGIVCFCLLMGQKPQIAAYLADLGMGVASGGLFAMILASRGKN